MNSAAEHTDAQSASTRTLQTPDQFELGKAIEDARGSLDPEISLARNASPDQRADFIYQQLANLLWWMNDYEREALLLAALHEGNDLSPAVHRYVEAKAEDLIEEERDKFEDILAFPDARMQ